MDEQETKVNTVRARQGATGHNVRYVLFGGLALALIAWVIVAYVVK